jgi:hypothetical protein
MNVDVWWRVDDEIIQGDITSRSLSDSPQAPLLFVKLFDDLSYFFQGQWPFFAAMLSITMREHFSGLTLNNNKLALFVFNGLLLF